MNLVWFLTLITIIATIFGEFGKYPFGNNNSAVSITDLSLFISMIILSIWKIAIKKDLYIPKMFNLIILFWGVGILSLILAKDFSGILYLFRFILYSSSFLLGFFAVREKSLSLEAILYFVFIAGTVTAIIGFLQMIFIPDFDFLIAYGFDPHKNRLASTFLDPNFTGAYLSISFIAGLYLLLKHKNKKLFFMLILNFAAIILTFSRSAYLMFIIQILILGLFRLKKLVIFTALIFILLYSLYLPFNQRINGAISLDKSASERFDSWTTGFKIVQKHFLFGIGFNNLRTYKSGNNLNKVFSDENTHSGAGLDSSLLVILATTGITGLSIYLAWWVILLKDLFGSVKKPLGNDLFLLITALSVGLFINSQFINSLFFPQIMLITYVIIGAAFSAFMENN